jgi:hypothetical protein
VVARGARPGVANEVTLEGIVAPTGVTQCRATPTDGRASFLGELERCDFVVGTSVFEFSSDGSGKGRFGFERQRVPGGHRDPVRREARSYMSEPSVYISLPRGTSIARSSKHYGFHLQLAQRRSGGIRPGIRDGRGSRSRHGESRRSSRASRPTRRRHVLHERLRLGYGRTFAKGEVEGGRRSASGTLLVSRSRGSLTKFAARASTSAYLRGGPRHACHPGVFWWGT